MSTETGAPAETTAAADTATAADRVNLLDLAAAAVCSTVSSARAIRAIESKQNARLKQDGSFVTDADYAAQGVIVQAIRSVSTTVRIVGEESPEEMAQHVVSNSHTEEDEILWQRTRREIRLVYHRHRGRSASCNDSSDNNNEIHMMRLPLAQTTTELKNSNTETDDQEPNDTNTSSSAPPLPNADDMADDPDEVDEQDCLVDASRVSVIVDPLDGTKSYTAGEYNVVSILIAIVVDNVPTFGVVGKPFGYPGLATILDTDCATVYGGLLLNAVYVAGSRRIVVDDKNSNSSDPAASSSSPSSYVPQQQPQLPRAVISGSRSRGVTYDFCKHLADTHGLVHPEPMTISGAGEKSLRLILRQHGEALWFFPKAGTSRWDVAAPDALLRALGGKLTDKYGRVLDYSANREEAENVHGVVASIHADLHAKCIALFQQGDWLERP